MLEQRLKMTDLLRTAVPATVRDIMTCSRDVRGQVEELFILTITLVRKANVQKTKWVFFPNLALMTCRKVLAPGALIFNMMERMEKMMICMVAPPAYQ